MCSDVWEQIFEYFEVIDLFTTFTSITVAADQVLCNENYGFVFRGFTLGTAIKEVPEWISVSRVVSMTLFKTALLNALEHCLELRSLKLIGETDWIRWIIKNIPQQNTKLNQLPIVTSAIKSLSELLIPILSISSLRRLEIYTDTMTENVKVSALAEIPNEIEQFIFDSGSTNDWNEFLQALSDFFYIRLLSISLTNRNQKSIPSLVFSNLRTLCLGLLEVSFNWIIQLVASTTSLLKLKLTGLVDADGFVVNQRWNQLFESASTVLRIFVNLSLEQSDESYDGEKTQVPLCALNLTLVYDGDDAASSLYYGERNRWWFSRGIITKSESYI